MNFARSIRRVGLAVSAIACCLALGCGTTRWTDTSRSGTEQLLISDAVDRAVSDINFRALEGHTVYFDPQYLKLTNPVFNFDDNHYLVSSLRQHIVASGCILKDKREDAELVVEARAGAIGTDRNDLLYGVPATNLSGVVPLQGVPATIPEIPLAKRTAQRGVAKVAVFAYDRGTGRPVWQSGVKQISSDAKNTWVLGIGPFQSGTIFSGPSFAGRKISNPLGPGSMAHAGDRPVWVTKEAYFESRGPTAQAEQVADQTPRRLPDTGTPTTPAPNAAPPGTNAPAAGTPVTSAPTKGTTAAGPSAAGTTAAGTNATGTAAERALVQPDTPPLFAPPFSGWERSPRTPESGGLWRGGDSLPSVGTAQRDAAEPTVRR